MIILKKQLMIIGVMLGIMLMTIACDFSTLIAPLLFAPTTSSSSAPPVIEEIVVTPTVNVSRGEDGAFILGDIDAPLTIIVFFDFFCVHCQNYEPTVQRILDEFVTTGEASVELRMFSVLGANSVLYAQLAECATIVSGDNSTFWIAYLRLFDYAVGRLDVNDALSQLGRTLNVSPASLLECVTTATQHSIDTALGYTIGISGVPAVRVRFAGDDLATVQVIGSQLAGGVDFDTVANFVRSNR